MRPALFSSNGKIYIDPNTYPRIDDAVNDFAFEIDKSQLKINDKIGEGEFAEVYRGKLYTGGKEKDVAIKRLKVSLIILIIFMVRYGFSANNEKKTNKVKSKLKVF